MVVNLVEFQIKGSVYPDVDTSWSIQIECKEAVVREWLQRLLDVLRERLIGGDDTLIAQILWKGTNDVTGTSVEFRESPVFDLENGRITRWTSRADTALFNATLQA